MLRATAALSLTALAAAAAHAPSPAAAQGPPCPMVTPAPPPVAGVEGFVFVAQHCPPAVEDRVPERFAVTVDYGDGTSGPGRLTADAFVAGGVHRYRRPGTYATKAVVRNLRTGEERTYTGSAEIRAPFAQLRRPRLRFTVDRLGHDQTLVAFESVLPYAADELRATVDWGDGTRSRGTVRRGTGRTFTVWGRHRYRRVRNRRLAVTVSHTSGAQATFRATALVGQVFDVVPGTAPR